jgi:hypothetical protein
MDDPEKKRRAGIPDRLKECGWVQADTDGNGCWFDGTPSSSDGIYFTYQAENDHFCLVIIGPMRETPYELNRRIGGAYRVCGLWVLPPSPSMDPARRQILLDRGLYRVDFEPRSLADRRLAGGPWVRTILPPPHSDEA